MSSLRQTKKALELELEDATKKIKALEAEILAAMTEAGLGTDGASFSDGEAKVTIHDIQYPQVQDWDAFGNFILENKYLHLLQKRPAVREYRELLALGRAVPGVLPFTERKLTFKE